MEQDIAFSQGRGFAEGPAEKGKNQQAPAAPADTEGVNPGENQQAPAQTKSTADPEGAKPEENQPKQEASTEEKPESAPAQSSAASAASTAPAETQNSAVSPAETQKSEGGGTLFMNTNRFIAVLWQSLKGIWEWIKSFFVGTMDDKMKEFMKFFSPERLMSMIGKTSKDIENVDSKVKGSIENLQRTVVSGVSGAASASIDMVLNAFSMMPAFGTVLLVWRMFQNLLVIMGATLSVQAGKDELTGKFYKEGVKNPGAADAAAKEGEATKPGTGGNGQFKPGSIAVEQEKPEPEPKHAANDNAQPAATAAQGPAQPAANATAKPAATAETAAQVQGPAQPAASAIAAQEYPYDPNDLASPQRPGGPHGPNLSGGRAGRRRVSSSMTKKINLETHRFKKSLKRHLHLRVPRVMPGGGGGGGGSAFKSGYAAL